MQAKEIAINTIQKMPNEVSFDEIIHALYINAKFEKGSDEIRNDKGISHEEAKKKAVKMAKVIWSPHALEDIDLIAEYIARDSYYRSSLFVSRLIESTDRLIEFGARKYDFLSGRFTSIDPLWEEYYEWTPYQYAGNKIILSFFPLIKKKKGLIWKI